MTLPYQYTPYIWPMLATAVFVSLLGAYAWRRRSVPGALPLAIVLLFGALWAVGAALVLAAVDVPTKIFWYKSIVAVCMMPIVIARFCFVLEYAGLGRLLTHRNLVLLSMPSLLVLVLVPTNDSHHWMWLDIVFDGTVRPLLGVGSFILTGFGYLLFLVNFIILVRLFLRSPRQRWPVALIICAMFSTHTFYALDILNLDPFAPLDPSVLSMNISFAMYGLALFRFHIFDPVPAARKTVIEQMREGMLVLDTAQKIVDLNPAAESILRLPAARVRGRDAAEILSACAGVSAGTAQSEISLPEGRRDGVGTGSALRHYELSLSPLKDRNDVLLGHLLLLHDVTEQRRAQAQLVEQQRVVATLQERERLARELHDSAGQVLGYVSLQAQAIRQWVHEGQAAAAEAELTRLADVAQGAHEDIRESILSLKAGAAHEWSFLATLQQHLDSFSAHFGIRTELTLPPGLEERAFEPGVGVQLLRVIQEALTNARKHGRARCVQVAFEFQASQARILVADDGRGFDPGQLSTGAGDHLGLAFMRERMAHVGGGLTIHSRPGAGTQVVLQFPIRDE